MSDKRELNPQYIIKSLRNQLSDFSIMVAEREAMVEEIGQELHDVKKELEELRKEQIAEMDA